MPFSLVTAGSVLKVVFPDGSIQALTLPSNTYINTSLRARFSIFDRNVIVVNATSKPVWVDPDGIVRPVGIPRPGKAPTVAAGAAGALSGTFRVKVAFAVKDDLGTILTEGPRGPASQPVTVSSQKISLTAIPLASDPAVNCRRVYRTATGPGTEYFEWFDLDDNTTTSYSDDALDADLSLFSAQDDLGTAPARMDVCVEWKGRLWAKNVVEPDYLRYSSDGKFYAWPEANRLSVLPLGKDRLGIVAIIPRRDELAICRRDIIWKVIGSSGDDFRMVKLIEGKGAISPDSVVVTRDVARWLAEDGVYEWDAEGVRCISDEKVHPWFTTDTYFNRAQFPNAFARYDPFKHAYELFLCQVGQTTFDRWVSYDIARKAWLGPHKTDAFTPTAAGVIFDANETLVPVICGSDEYVYQVTPATFHDGTATGIEVDFTGKFHSGKAPDMEHYWGELSILTRVDVNGGAGTILIFPKVGRMDALAQPVIFASYIKGRTRLRRLGVGALCQLRIANTQLDQELEIYGYEIPFHELGRR